jgi:hypothetical protein
MKKLLIILGSIVILSTGTYYLFSYLNRSSVKPYTPPPSLTSVDILKGLLPYKSETFDISWNESTNQAEAVISKPYPDSANDLVNWLAENQANNLPKNTIKIIRK